MPRKPKRPCSFPGCPNLTDGRYCEKHQKIIDKRYEKYERSPVSKKRYGRTWKKIRDAYVASHPLCELCLKNGRYVVAEEVHHKKPLAEGADLNGEDMPEPKAYMKEKQRNGGKLEAEEIYRETWLWLKVV